MDFQEKKLRPNPRAKANPLSILFFSWINPLFRKGYKKDLSLEDLYDVLSDDESGRLGDQLETAWKFELQKSSGTNKSPKLYKAFISCFWRLYAFLFFGLLVDECVIRVAQPLFLKALINSFSSTSDEGWKQYGYAAGVCVTTLLHTLLLHPTMFATQHVGMKCRVSACSLMYRKILRLSKRSLGKTTIGQIVNLLSNDVIRFDTNLMFIPYLIIGPVQLGIFTYILWQEMGVATLAGVAFVVALIPIEYLIGVYFTRLRLYIAKNTDERGRVMNEIIIAMRVIKMYAWEKPFGKLIHAVRKSEVNQLRKSALLRSIYVSLYISSAKMVTYFVFLTYILRGSPLTADKVFFCSTIFNTVRQLMISFFPQAAAMIGELIVSMSRIETFLLLEDQKANKDNNPNVKIVENIEGGEPSIKMDNLSASWTGDKDNLSGINLNLQGNKVVMVVGQVGSGKTSFLHTILSELPVTSGSCEILGRVSYASQEPWIFGGNVRQNIMFGLPFDEERYKNAVNMACLDDDFSQLPHGDMTMVGERGVALSGGQKARVNLARALYQEADIYLLDDPLSAVDSKVGKHIFEKCVKDGLKGHLRILCTHQLQYLPLADWAIVLDEGKILAQGRYEDLAAQGVDFVGLMAASDSVDDAASKMDQPAAKDPKAQEVSTDTKKSSSRNQQTAAAEQMSGGSVTLKSYLDYFSSADSGIFLFSVIFFFVTSQLGYAAADYFLSMWTSAEERRLNWESENSVNGSLLRHTWIPRNNEVSYLGEATYLYSYTGLVVAIFVLTKARAVTFFLYCMRISVRLHNKMFQTLVRAPIKFFDDNPSGRIMNRFTKDLGSMDELLPYTFFDALTIFLLMVTMVALIIYANYYMAIPTAFLLLMLYLIRTYFIRTARDVKRIEAISRSPIFTHVAASVQGLTTIRSADREVILAKQYDGNQDYHSATWYTFISANRWFGIWLEMITVAYLTIVTFSFLLLAAFTDYRSSDVGLAISSALNLTGVFQWGMRQSAETENLMTSVERILEYTKLESEAELESSPPSKKPPSDWPSQGQIQFHNFFLAYDGKDVVKGLTFSILAREKIGIVGRTGAGKSSIINGLFRMTEPRGDLFIDGVRVIDIGLHELRGNISIIPQDPVLFSGTMRYNLDPFNQYADNDLWQSLQEVELKDAVPSLDFKVSDGGSNFSVGERQLVCLARAILRKNRIIVMDEATANVDPRTDAFIQKTIRSKFADCTILTIAHRLNSVMDCDKILVLDNGYLREYDHPHILLSDPEGILTSMVNHVGQASADVLREMAAGTYQGRRSSFSASNIPAIRHSISISNNTGQRLALFNRISTNRNRYQTE